MYLFQDEPGFAITQYGQSGSSELISFRQFGHSIDFFPVSVIKIPLNAVD
jgi:hypothetical protein